MAELTLVRRFERAERELAKEESGLCHHWVHGSAGGRGQGV